jgi:L-ornithine N5-oxygenase
MTSKRLVDLLGIGFGPSNLALAIAVSEHNDSFGSTSVSANFLEKKQRFSWHPGMLLEGATMQVSFLKDLVTLRNPSSRFTFLQYLHKRERLVDFIKHKCFYPSRLEFHDYLDWCAAEVTAPVDYGHTVVSAKPVMAGGVAERLEVTARDESTGALTTRLTRNLVIAPGLIPRLPAHLSASARIWHSSTFLDELKQLKQDEPRRFVVLGAGQSAAEITEHLHRTYPHAEVCAVLSRFGYSQADDSPMANRIFDPATVDVFYSAPDEVKVALGGYHANTNYSVVDVALIEELYRRAYQERVAGTSRLRLLNVSTVTSAQERHDHLEVTVRNQADGTSTVLAADALICATGYTATDPLSLLGEVGPLLESDGLGRLAVGRDYRVASDPRLRAGIYLCGGTEHSHGITSSLLSNTAVRAGEILSSVISRQAAQRPAMTESAAR